jgi:hypothetical protein
VSTEISMMNPDISLSHSHALNQSHSHARSQSSNFEPPRAQSNWDVQDTKLAPIPNFYPPIPPNCTTYISDTSATPSIIASRISECLKKRSMVVEFESDDAKPTATCLNQDGVLFVICLYRGGKWGSMGMGGAEDQSQSLKEYVSGSNSRNGSKSPSSFDGSRSHKRSTSKEEKPDFSHGVIVECMKLRGDSISFQRDCQAVLTCANGDSDGLDDLRSPNVALMHSSPGFGCLASRAEKPFGRLTIDEICQFEDDLFPPLVDIRTSSKDRSPMRNAKKDSDIMLKALRSVLDMVEKDRFDARLLGMESLVRLTDVRTSGLGRAYLASLTILGSPIDGVNHSGEDGEDDNVQILSELQDRLISFSTGKFTRKSMQAHLMAESDEEESYHEEYDPSDIFTEYNIKIRRCAMHAVTNALSNIIRYSDNFPLLPKPSCEEFMTVEFLEKLGDDLRGAGRPPSSASASLGTTAHEATFAAKFIYLIASYSEEGYDFVNGAVVGAPPWPISDLLEMVRSQGVSRHRALEIESQLALHYCK